MTEWNIRFKSFLEAEECLEGLTEENPKLDSARVECYRRERRRREADRLEDKHERKLKKWRRKNAKTYHALLSACTPSPAAMMIIMSNKGATAKVIYEKLTEKFNLESITLGLSEKATDQLIVFCG